MESTQLYGNLSTAVSETTRKHKSDFCYPYTSVYFDSVGSIIPYAVNAALNALLAIIAIFGNSLVFAAVRHSSPQFATRFALTIMIQSQRVFIGKQGHEHLIRKLISVTRVLSCRGKSVGEKSISETLFRRAIK